jgi:hypothetical protein
VVIEAWQVDHPLALERSPEELQPLMEMLIGEWKRQARDVMERLGYEVAW